METSLRTYLTRNLGVDTNGLSIVHALNEQHALEVLQAYAEKRKWKITKSVIRVNGEIQLGLDFMLIGLSESSEPKVVVIEDGEILDDYIELY